MSEHLFEDTFVVTRLDPDGKKFDRGKFFLKSEPITKVTSE
jgi:hypothetical protein